MDIAALTIELAAGHPVTGTYNVDDELAAGECNAENIDILVALSTQELREWAAEGNRGLTIFEGISGAATPNQQNICYILDKLFGTDNGQLNPNNANDLAMINILVSANILTSDDRDALALKATRTISRMTQLKLGWARPGNVKEARS